MDITKLDAIDVHVHADVSCCGPETPNFGKFLDASKSYFNRSAPPDDPRKRQD